MQLFIHGLAAETFIDEQLECTNYHKGRDIGCIKFHLKYSPLASSCLVEALILKGGKGAPVVERSKSSICDHSAPNCMGSSPSQGKNFHVGRSTS